MGVKKPDFEEIFQNTIDVDVNINISAFFGGLNEL